MVVTDEAYPNYNMITYDIYCWQDTTAPKDHNSEIISSASANNSHRSKQLSNKTKEKYA